MATRLSARLAYLIAPLVLVAVHLPAAAALTWTWSYSGSGVAASGSLTTNDTPDALGYYAISGIAGQRNGVAISGLQAAGTAIPGNEPFAVDNLIRETGEQLSGEGLGFSLADGTYSNAFFASFLATPGYLEFFSAAPFSSTGPEDGEVQVRFAASIARNDVPEPTSWSLVAIALSGWAISRRKPRRTSVSKTAMV